MSSTNVLILNVFNVYQTQSRWNGRLSEEQPREANVSKSFEDVIDLCPKDGVWEAACKERPSLEPHNPCVNPYDRLTYSSRGVFASVPSITGVRINLVV